jgi:hypothetical protein
MTDLTVIRLVATPMPAHSAKAASPERAIATAPCAPATSAAPTTTGSATGNASAATAKLGPQPVTASEIASHNLGVKWVFSPIAFVGGVELQMIMLMLALLIFFRKRSERREKDSIAAAEEAIRKARSVNDTRAYSEANAQLTRAQHRYDWLHRGPSGVLVSVSYVVPLVLFSAFLLLTILFCVQVTPQKGYAEVLGLRLVMTSPGWQVVDATSWLAIVFVVIWIFRFWWDSIYDAWSLITRKDDPEKRTFAYTVVDTTALRALMIVGGLVLAFVGLAFANGIVSPNVPPRPVEARESPTLIGSVPPFWQTFEATFNGPRTLGMDDSAVVSVGFRMQRARESTWLAHESTVGPKRIGYGKYHAYLVAPAFRVDDIAADPIDVRYTHMTCWSWTIQPRPQREGVQVIQAVIEHDVNGHRKARWESVRSEIEVPHRIAAETWLKSSAPFLTFALGFISILVGLFKPGAGRAAKSRAGDITGEGR